MGDLMLAEERAAFWEKLSELGFIIYCCEDYKTVVSKFATPLDDSDFEESFCSKTAAIEKVKSLIDWKWQEKEKIEIEEKEIIKVKISMTYKVPAGLNNTELGFVEHFDQDEIVKEADKKARIYFSKNYPAVNIENIKYQIAYAMNK